ncbi:sensor histidine kinase [Terrilactibacillus laevilacticus]|uniref:Sensor histidine kinase n=1 Tax=Terrilactibacillus laevilacticus TaxID=1380157 RepID=A0ABW5PUM3_9BACI|nr:histidine kinase [Terrilactibacillus laevilacticus]
MKLFSIFVSLLNHHCHSFRKKLLLSFVAIAIIPVLFIGCLSYMISYHIANDKILESVSHSSSQLNQTLTFRFNQLDIASNILQYYMYTLIFQGHSDVSDQINQYSEIRNHISNLKNDFHISNITIYIKPNLLFSNEGITFFKLNNLPSQRHISQYTFLKNINQLHWKLFKNMKEPFVSNPTSQNKNFISAYRLFKKQNENSLEYAYFIDINEREISRLLLKSKPYKNIKSYIVNQKGHIISNTEQLKLGKSIPTSLLAKIKNNEKFFILQNKQFIVRYNPTTKWYIVTEIPEKYIINNTILLVYLILITVGLVIIMAIISSILLSNSLSKKVRSISTFMSSYSFKYEKKHHNTEISTIMNKYKIKDEFDQLIITFNTMIGKLNENFDRLLESKIREEKMAYQLEQSRINPHFLYNMLETIKTCQSLGRIDDASSMLTKLAKFYRITLKKGNDLISIRDELNIANLYLEMEKLNKLKSFQWTINKEKDIEHFLIPKLTLQPLLENCLHHGFVDSIELNIRISLYFQDEDIIIEIKDNGKGVPANKLIDMRKTLESGIINTQRFFGISNVNKRLSLYSHNYPPLSIDSVDNEGTTITISIQQNLPDEFIR